MIVTYDICYELWKKSLPCGKCGHSPHEHSMDYADEHNGYPRWNDQILIIECQDIRCECPEYWVTDEDLIMAAVKA